jgi:hypothetical protein
MAARRMFEVEAIRAEIICVVVDIRNKLKKTFHKGFLWNANQQRGDRPYYIFSFRFDGDNYY